jgi:arsenite methyltransferase
MNTVQVYDPPMCCSTGICGPEVDPNLVQFAVLLSQLQQRGVAVERYNLGRQPMAFVQNPKVKALLETGGTEALPVVFWDGEIVMQGEYPDHDERTRWITAAATAKVAP